MAPERAAAGTPVSELPQEEEEEEEGSLLTSVRRCTSHRAHVRNTPSSTGCSLWKIWKTTE